MGIELVLPTSPKIGLEVFRADIFGSPEAVYARIYTTDAAGNMDNVGDYALKVEAGSKDTDQLKAILAYCGIVADPVEWLAKTNKEDAVKAITKWVREKFIPALTAAVNKFITGNATSPAVPYKTVEEMIQDVVVAKIVWNVSADGSVNASIP